RDTDVEMGHRRGADGEWAAGAGEAAGDGVGGRDGLGAGRLQGGEEGADAVRSDEGRGGGGGSVGAREVHRTRVAGGRVVERIQRRHRDAEGATGATAAGGADAEVGSCRGADREGVAGAGEGTGRGVGGRQRLVAGGLQGGEEGAVPV